MKGAPAWTRHALVLPLACLVLGFMARAAIIGAVPSNYSFDGFQRWAGRDHLLVQDWLPLTQSILVFNETLGGDLYSARMALSLVAAVGMAMAAVVARQMGGSLAGWCFVPLSLFGPALCWTAVPYQEGTYLALLMSGLALAFAAREEPEKNRLRLGADLLIGATALCRTEGWPLVLLYMLWWRDKASLRSLWGVVLWLGWKWGIGIESHRPGPVSYADWEGLPGRFDWAVWIQSLLKHGRHWGSSGGWTLWVGGLAGAWWLFRRSDDSRPYRKAVTLLLWILAAQLASTLAWMVGLETATVRMTLLPGVMLAVLSAVFLGRALPQLSRPARGLGVFSLVSLGLFFASDGWIAAHRASRMVRWERVVVLRMEQCPDCYFQIKPRRGLGTRDRHDGCEIIQGISDWRHPEDFHCKSWPEEPVRAPTHRSWWKRSGYEQEELKSD